MIGWYNDEARKLALWYAEENNRIKASHIMRVAERMEVRYIKNGGMLENRRPSPGVISSPGLKPLFIGRPERTQ